MGVDTKGFPLGKRSYEEIVVGVTNIFPNAEVISFTKPGNKDYEKNGETHCYYDPGFMSIRIPYVNKGGEIENRSLSVIVESSDNNLMIPGLGDHTYLSLGKWGESVELMTILLNHFGGFLIPDDCACNGDRPDTYQFIEGSMSQIFTDAESELLSDIGFDGIEITEKLRFFELLKQHKDAINKFYNKG